MKHRKDFYPYFYDGVEVGSMILYYDNTAMCKVDGYRLNSKMIRDLNRIGFVQNPDDFTEFHYDPLKPHLNQINQVKE